MNNNLNCDNVCDLLELYHDDLVRPTTKEAVSNHLNECETCRKEYEKIRGTMRNKNNKHLGIEIDPELHYKLHYISKYYGRSANGEILYLVRQAIKKFEETEGRIEYPPQETK